MTCSQTIEIFSKKKTDNLKKAVTLFSIHDSSEDLIPGRNTVFRIHTDDNSNFTAFKEEQARRAQLPAGEVAEFFDRRKCDDHSTV